MSVESDIRNALLPLALGGVFFDSAPFDTALPYIVVTQIGGTPVSYLESVLPDKRHGRFQVNAWDSTRAKASALGRAVEKALVETPAVRATVLNGLSYRFDTETAMKGTEQDFGIWFVG